MEIFIFFVYTTRQIYDKIGVLIMGKRPRISSLLSNRDNSDYIRSLEQLSLKLERLAERKACLMARHDNWRDVNRLIETEQREVTDAMAQLRLKNSRDATIFSERYRQSDTQRGGRNLMALRSLKNDVNRTMYFERAKQLLGLITAYNQSQKPEDKQKVEDYINSVGNKGLFGILNAAVAKFKEKPSIDKLNTTNTLLGYFHKKIVQEEYHSSINSHNVMENAEFEFNSRKVARADFNGGFYTPTSTDLAKHNPFSETYQKFLLPQNRGHRVVTTGADYDLDNCPAWQACRQSENFRKLEPHLRQSLVSKHIPPQIIKDLNAVDLMDVMTPAKFTEFRGNKSVFVSYQSLNPECTQGERKTFLDSLKNNDRLKKKFNMTLDSVSIGHGKALGQEVHHNDPINTYGVQANGGTFSIMMTYLSKDEQKEHKNDADYDDIHDFMHTADMVLRRNTHPERNNDPEFIPVELDRRHNGDITFHMIDTRVEKYKQQNKMLVLSGLRDQDAAALDFPQELHKSQTKQQSPAPKTQAGKDR